MASTSRVAAVAITLGVLWSTSASAVGPSFKGTYKALGTGTACNGKGNLVGREPDPAIWGAGPYPVFVFTTGTFGNYQGPEALRFVDEMAARGFIAASVSYPNNNIVQNCSAFENRARCVYDQASAVSAVSVLCARPHAQCSGAGGVVSAGFSQGSFLAVRARNHSPRVRATYAMGTGNFLSGMTDLAACMNDQNTLLPTDRLLAIDGASDAFFGGNAETIRTQLEAVTGVPCGAGALECRLPNGAGWYIVDNTEVVDGTADHCYQRGNANCADTLPFDANWAPPGAEPWSLAPGLDWLVEASGL